jgi:hypothetical protein
MYDSSGPFNCGYFLSFENAEAKVKELEKHYGPYKYGPTPFSSKGYSFHIHGPFEILDWKDNAILHNE